jgi:signal transduction histidine kinase
MSSDPQAPRLLTALAAAAPELALALVDADGRIAWCSQAFARAMTGAGAGVDALQGTAASAWLGDEGGPGRTDWRTHWRMNEEDAGAGQRLLRLLPLQDAEALQRTVADLRERMAMLQEFCHAGIFERDPRTMEGHWDEQMYRIFGLPAPAAGTPAPEYKEASRLFFAEDRTPGSFVPSLGRPGNHGSRMRLRRPDGQVRHIHSQWKVFHDEQGRANRVLGVNIDDTATYELARQAQKLREELELALQLSDIGLWRHDLRAGRVFLDERAARHMGLHYRSEGHAAQEVRARIHPDDLAIVDDWRAVEQGGGSISDLAIRFRRPEGGWRHVLARRSLQRDEAGKPLAFVGVLLDESVRVEHAERAQRLSRRLESAAEAARIGLWSSPVDDEALPDWNARNYELFGLDPAEGPLRLGEWLRRCAHPEDRARLAELGSLWAREGSGPFAIEYRARHRDGSLRWLITRGQVAAATADAPRRLEGVTIDITEQQETLQRLRESSQRLELTAAAIGLGTWEFDEASPAMVWDSAMFRLRGVDSPRRAIELEEIWSYLHPDDRARVIPEQVDAFEKRQSWRGSFRVVWPDGTVRWLASRSMILLDADGRPQRRIGLNWDITDLMEAEQAIRERERAVASSLAKSRFLSRISHELRTPLNAVLGFTHLLRQDRGQTPPEERRRWLMHIDDAGRHLLALIDDVLDLSRAESGDLHLTPQDLALRDLVQSTLSLVEREAGERGIALQVEALPHARVWADPVRARQVLLNLLSNAIKYNRPGGQVRLSVQAEPTQVRLQVRDSGRGIDPARLQAAFEPFNRLGAERLGIEGTGIGLAIAKALVEQMQGRIEACSRPGEGSVFAFTLPVSAAAASTSAPAAAPPPPAAAGANQALPAPAPQPAPAGPQAPPPARVLYIEDNEINAMLVREILASYPWVSLRTAADGRSGLALAHDWRPDLVLLDMQLPDMDGLAVMRALQADAATAGLRCVALSANAMPEDIAKARAAGVVDYWTKPIELPVFVDKLQALLRP